MDQLEAKIKAVIEKVRPALQADGGDIDYVSHSEGVVKVRLKGACSGCPMSQMTLKNGVEKMVKKELPEIIRVESV